ncbi:MAG: hypothetical protein IJ037_01655 [Clostridia bacterium]|nr:hypothetical protein [Clostridia bacterium]
MGFGILLIGYFVTFAFSISSYYFFADIFGLFIILYAFSKLSKFNRYFIDAMLPALVFLVLCGTGAAAMMFDLYPMDGTADLVVDILKIAAACVMHVFVFLGTRGISLGASSDKLVKKTERNFVATMIYYTANLAIVLLSFFVDFETQYVSTVVYLYWIVCIVLNLALFYHCFGILIPADEDEDAVKRSKFEFINKINDKFDELDIKSNEYRKQSMQMAMDEAMKRAEEKKKNEKPRHVHPKKKK